MRGGFIDREVELSALEATLEKARTGTPVIVSLEGPAGIGKSALLNTFRTGMRGAQSILVAGDESETILPFGVVGQLLQQFGRYDLVCSHILAGHSLEDLDSFKVGALLLESLGEIQAGVPLLIIIEDAHWADRDSLQALAFAFRRLLADQVLLLLSIRDQSWSQLPAALHRLLEGERGRRITLRGLPPADVRRLGEEYGWSLSRSAALRLYQHTDGNPLYIKALLAELEPAALEAGWERPLPSPRWFHEIVLQRLAHCSETSRDVIEAAAVLGARCPLDRALHLSNLHDPLTPLDEALASRLLILKDGISGPELHFEHPLIRADVYHALALSKRSTLHRRAANLSLGEAISLQHEVAATYGYDPELAARVEEFGRRQVGKASWTAAATAFLAAAQLIADHQKRESCMLDAVDCRLLAGDVAAAKQLAGDLTQYSSTPQRNYIAARLLMVPGAVVEAGELYERAWAEITTAGKPDAGLAARVAGWYATTLELQGRSREAIEWARRALQSRSSEFSRSSFALLVLLLCQGSAGQAAGALQTLSQLPTDPLAVGPEQCERLLGRGALRMVMGELVTARDDLRRATELAHHQGTPFLLTLALGFLADTEYRLGEWDAAIAHGEQGTSTASDADQVFLVGWTHAIAAFPHIGRGAMEQAEKHIRAAEHLGDSGRLSATFAHATMARARLELMAGHPVLAAKSLEAFFELNAEPAEEPGVQPWRLLYAEALCEQGKLDAASAALDRAEDRIHERGLRSLLITVGRLRGQLALHGRHIEQALRAFESSLSHAHEVTAPFEVARLELAYGSLLRRLGRRRAAKEALESASKGFLQLRAQRFVVKCDGELGGTGLKPIRRTTDERHLLTSQELAVARLVAEGLSNRETAAQLVISPKTVEYHLVNIFGKLGVRSRSQLVHRLLQQA